MSHIDTVTAQEQSCWCQFAQLIDKKKTSRLVGLHKDNGD